ncbi:MAG: hypothetical protein QW567_03270 [Candidatus Hadarchaeales archaeon]
MDSRGQLMGVPIKLVMALTIGAVAMGIMMQFMGTAERSGIKDMDVALSVSSNRLTVKVYDAATGNPLNNATVIVSYPGGTKAQTLGVSSNQYTFTIPLNGRSNVVVNVRVTHSGYMPWESQVVVG